MAATNARIRIPKGSKRLFKPVRTPETAKAKVPIISRMRINFTDTKKDAFEFKAVFNRQN